MQVIALSKFEGIRDKERNVYPKTGDVWETSEERAKFLEQNGYVEIIEEEKAEMTDEQKAINIVDGGETERFLNGENFFVPQDITIQKKITEKEKKKATKKSSKK